MRPALLAERGVSPALTVEGPAAASVIAFARRLADDWVDRGRPCAALRLLGGADRPRIPPANWQDTAVVLPPSPARARFVNLLTGEEIARVEACRLRLP